MRLDLKFHLKLSIAEDNRVWLKFGMASSERGTPPILHIKISVLFMKSNLWKQLYIFCGCGGSCLKKNNPSKAIRLISNMARLTYKGPLGQMIHSPPSLCMCTIFLHWNNVAMTLFRQHLHLRPSSCYPILCFTQTYVQSYYKNPTASLWNLGFWGFWEDALLNW